MLCAVRILEVLQAPELSSMPVLLDEREAGAASRALDATSQPPPGALSPECSAGSDFAARRATLKPLPKQDSGVPEAMATKGTEELPQFHENAGPQSSASELSPDTVCRAPPNGVGLQRIDRPRRVDRPGAVAKGSTITMQNRRPYRSVKPVALSPVPPVHVVLADVSAVGGAEQVAKPVSCSRQQEHRQRSRLSEGSTTKHAGWRSTRSSKASAIRAREGLAEPLRG